MHLRILIAVLALAALVFLVKSLPAQAKDYNYMSAQELKAMLDSKAPLHLVDIQVEDEFAKHHIEGAVSTCAYPVKSDADKAKLGSALADIQNDALPVVIVCPRGAGGATRTYDYLQEQGVPESRLYILEKGQAGWPY